MLPQVRGKNQVF